MRSAALIAILILVVAAPAFAGEGPATGAADVLHEPPLAGHAISVGDTIEIRVYRREDLSLSLTVPPSGSVVLPLIGEVKVAGKSPIELIGELKARFAAGGHLARPDVTVLVSNTHPKKVYVLGAVNATRAVPMPPDGRFTLTQAIAEAGGFQDGADTKDVKLLRRGVPVPGGPRDAGTRVMRINVDAITEKSRIEFDVQLQPGDRIIVPKREEVFVLGQVSRPGAYTLGRGKWTLMKAIAKAGGFTQYARTTRVRVVSRDGANGTGEARHGPRTVDVREIINAGKIENDIELRPGDVVFVPESIF